MNKIEERVLGHILSKEEMAQVSGGTSTGPLPPCTSDPISDAPPKTPKPPKIIQ